jgi:hypothetical protein
MAVATMLKANLDSVDPDTHGRISKQTAQLKGVPVTRVAFCPQARWSEDLKEYAGTESCELPHVAIVLEGALHVVMDVGSEDEFGPNDVMLCHPVMTPGASAARGDVRRQAPRSMRTPHRWAGPARTARDHGVGVARGLQPVSADEAAPGDPRARRG